MKVKTLKLTNFRNHLSKEISFSDEINLILGPNGSGKTNILEAIYLISTTKSPRTKYDKDLINYDQNFCTVGLDEENNHLELQVIKSEKFDNASLKKAKVNKTQKALGYFAGIFNSVLFTPEDILIITGSPTLRRKYMDMVLIQTSENYKSILMQYVRAVKQRNKLLERINEGGFGFGQMDYWNEQILKLGKTIQQKRIELFEYIRTAVRNHYEKLNKGNNGLDITYKRNEINEERMEKYKDKEVFARTTLIGPHRDDFELYLNGKNLAYFGSRGQQRTALLALKLAEIDFIEEKIGERPVLLLDDIFSELDEKHRGTVMETIGKQQCIITSTEVLNAFKDETYNLIELIS